MPLRTESNSLISFGLQYSKEDIEINKVVVVISQMLVLWNLSLLVAPLITDYTGFIIYIMSEREIILRDSISLAILLSIQRERAQRKGNWFCNTFLCYSP